MSWFKKVFSGKQENPDHSPTTDKSGDQPIDESEADEVLAEDNRSMLSQMIASNGLKMDMDLSKITLPTFILEPRSLLEKLGDTVVHPTVFADIARGSGPEERLVRVVRWYMAAYHKRPRGVKKPFNPVLGEIFASKFSSEGCKSEDEVSWFSEQVSHHPPVSAFYARTASGSVVMSGHFAPKSRFLGNSAASIGGGGFRIFLPEHNEVYYLSWPTVYVRGILFGRLLMELGGPVAIRCPSTNLHADIEFVVKGYFTGIHNAVKGDIFASSNPDNKKERVVLRSIEGTWIEKMNVKDAKSGSSEVLFDYKNTKMGSCSVDDESEFAKDPYFSRLHWKEAMAAVAAGNNEEATKHKTAVEDAQRALRAERKEKGETFQPRSFKVVKELEDYQFIGEGAIPIPTE